MILYRVKNQISRIAIVGLLGMGIFSCGGSGGTDFSFLLALAGGGGGSSGGDESVTGTAVTVTGTVQYEHVPVNTTSDTLNTAGITNKPARYIKVELVNSTGSVLATTTSSNTGSYTLSGSPSSTFTIRMVSEMVQTTSPTYDFKVKNAAPGTSVGTSYAVSSDSQDVSCEDSCSVNLTALDSNRGSGPFSILDVIRKGVDKVYTADASTVFPTLHVKWQTTTSNGSYFTTSSSTCGTGISNCIVLLGRREIDSDEFDLHVMAHEFTHYLESALSRSDSIGGAHSSNDLLEPRIAYGEGLGNAMGAIINDDPEYTDTSNAGGFGFNMETRSHSVKGYYSEGSVQSAIWDLYDSNADSGDSLSLGFAPIWLAVVDLKNINGITYIHEFISALRLQATGNDTAITNILAEENIAANAASESNKSATTSAGSAVAHTCNAGGSEALWSFNPIIQSVTGTGTQVNNVSFKGSQWCGATSAAQNKLFGSQFFQVTPTNSGLMSVTATDSGLANEEPDCYVYEKGVLKAAGATSGSDSCVLAVSSGKSYVVEVRTYSGCMGLLIAGGACTAGQYSAAGENAYSVSITLP